MAIVDIESFTPPDGCEYFLDCNVLMYLFYQNGGYAESMVQKYSAFLTQIYNSDSKIVLTDMVISEFINTYVRYEFNRLAEENSWPTSRDYFKKSFKLTQEYEDILKEIQIIINRQLKPIAVQVSNDFENFDISSAFEPYSTFDFNDRYYGEVMKGRNAYIVTNDADFSDVDGCTIITCNKALLSAAH